MHKFKLEPDFEDMSDFDPRYYSKRDYELMQANNFKDYYTKLHGKPPKKKSSKDKVKEINDYVEDLVDKALNNGVKKFISKIDDSVNFRYNSFNICIGKQGTSKTTSVMKELIKLSMLPNDYHMILYVTNNDSDDSVNSLKDYIDIPIVKTNYDLINDQFEELIKLKDEYNKMVDGVIPKDSSILKPLLIKDFNKKRLHTFILFDDSAFIFDKTKKSPFKQWLLQCRHLNLTAFCNIQSWTSIDPRLKEQLSSIYLFKGFSRERVQYIHKQINLDVDFEEFWKLYQSLKKYSKLVIDCIDGSYKIV